MVPGYEDLAARVKAAAAEFKERRRAERERRHREKQQREQHVRLCKELWPFMRARGGGAGAGALAGRRGAGRCVVCW